MPEHTFSDIVSDGAAAFERLLAAGLRPEQVALAGDSPRAGTWPSAWP
uniref:Uncharacterized protein n=1 Tax=Tetraselmis sp. GSL018 TaxID=582737 RepID=A0A061RD83_9CHLO